MDNKSEWVILVNTTEGLFHQRNKEAFKTIGSIIVGAFAGVFAVLTLNADAVQTAMVSRGKCESA
jgi:hypothetical protein